MSAQLFEISRSAMDVEWKRVELVAQNVANLGTSSADDASVYRPLRLLSAPRAAGSSFSGMLAAHGTAALRGVRALAVEPQATPARLVHEPGHPHADANGMVRYPGVDHVSEMTTMMKAVRAYEANVAMLNAGRSMFIKALEIGNRA
jgi:flagellar basal-body rod protein FlgC